MGGSQKKLGSKLHPGGTSLWGASWFVTAKPLNYKTQLVNDTKEVWPPFSLLNNCNQELHDQATKHKILQSKILFPVANVSKQLPLDRLAHLIQQLA